MKDTRCFICKYKQDISLKAFDDVIFDANGNSVVLPLCYNHSVELFKSGQRPFLMKYKNIFSGSYGLENDLALVNQFSNRGRERPWY